MTEQIRFWNREKLKLEEEQVYGDRLVRLLYQTRPGQILTNQLLAKPWLSKIFGAYQNSRISRRDIDPFVKRFKIQMNEYEKTEFRSFNEFFVRKFTQRARPFVGNGRLPAFAEGRYFGFKSLSEKTEVPVKGLKLNIMKLLGDKDKALRFINGPALIARLCPVDYHRFHFPDDGKIKESWKNSGFLHSVNPVALQFKGDIFLTNERHVSILDTAEFGELAYIEVGALCVGKIRQTHSSKTFHRGDEKGYFLFGGSTVIVVGESSAWVPDDDVLSQTEKGFETFVKLGEQVGHKTP